MQIELGEMRVAKWVSIVGWLIFWGLKDYLWLCVESLLEFMSVRELMGVLGLRVCEFILVSFVSVVYISYKCLLMSL